MSAVLEFSKKVAKHTDIALALGIVTVLLFLLLPVPAFLLDVMLAFSISTSLVILVTTLLISTPLDLSVFPSLLLITTIIRLSLNVASTKLILANGHLGDKAAGQVISAFGHFVMQGNVVIGAIIFLILTIVNFVVITKGSSRIAEVAARFSLDAMPGKQMAIDAELSSGMIDNQTAKARRKNLEEETTFYGSMDGANKFVRGDAIAGVIITFINIIGGIIIGIVQRNLPLDVAVRTYSVLTIGDGLTCQIPSVIISLSAGLLVTKASNSGSSDQALFSQLSKRPRALFLAAALSSTIALLPGLPFFPFFLISGALGGLAYLVSSISKEKTALTTQKFTPPQPLEENVAEVLKLDTIKVELGMGLLSLAAPYAKNSLPKKFKLLRKQIAAKLGFILPPIRLQDNTLVNRNDYLIKIKEIVAGQGTVFPEKHMVMSITGKDINIEGIDCKEPAFGLPAKWIDPINLESAQDYTVLDSTSVITTHLTQVIKENITDLLSYTDVQGLIEETSKTHKKLIQDLIPDVLNISKLQKILHKLLLEGISIKDLPTILESAGDASSKGQNVILITEFVRNKLSRQICAQNANAKGNIPVIAISDSWENKLIENMYDAEEEKQIVLPPSELNAFLTKVQHALNDNVRDGMMPAILVSSGIRPYVRNLIAKIQPMATVLGHKELHSKYPLEHLGTV
jgi:flagellar biosynthesis protein FlhA